MIKKYAIIYALVTVVATGLSACSSSDANNAKALQGTWLCGNDRVAYNGSDYSSTSDDGAIFGTFNVKGDRLEKTISVVRVSPSDSGTQMRLMNSLILDGRTDLINSLMQNGYYDEKRDAMTISKIEGLTDTALDTFTIERYENGVRKESHPSLGHKYHCEKQRQT